MCIQNSLQRCRNLAIMELDSTEWNKGLKELSYFELFWRRTKSHLNGKNENSTLVRWKNTKEIIINHEGTKMAKYGEDYNTITQDKLERCSPAKRFKIRKP